MSSLFFVSPGTLQGSQDYDLENTKVAKKTITINSLEILYFNVIHVAVTTVEVEQSI